jgi:formylglycine-generating enzyme required for sulfatase activity
MDHKHDNRNAPTGDCPVLMVTWYDAAAYCNWLSEQEGIAREQWCYVANKEGKYAEGMKMAPNSLKRTGYRLPTDGEWEYACRAGADTGYSYGESEDLLGKYAWFSLNSLNKSHPVGSLKANDLGLFDMHGNAWEWCQDAYQDYYRKGGDGKAAEDMEYITDIKGSNNRVLRGGSFTYPASLVDSASSASDRPASRFINIGFRLARTVPP